MKTAFGKEVPTSLNELVDPARSALLVIDVQNDYAKRNGVQLFPDMVNRVGGVIDEARRAGVLVIYIQDTLLAGRFSDSPAWLRHYMLAEKKADPAIICAEAQEGTAGHRIIDEIAPRQGELIVQKYRSSAFVGTSLNLLLRSNGIRNVIATGLITYGCVESTCRDASNEYFVVVVRDCVDAERKDLHEANLKVMESRYDVVDSHQLIEAWRACKEARRV